MSQNASESKTLLCPVCGRRVARKRRWQAFCSPKCRKAAWLISHRTGTYTDVRDELGEIRASLSRIEAHIGLSIQPPFKSAPNVSELAPGDILSAVGSPRNAHAQDAGEGVRVNSQEGEGA